MYRATPFPTLEQQVIPIRWQARPSQPQRGTSGSIELIVGERIRATRMKAGLSSAQCARISNLSRSQMSRVERGLITPSLQTLVKVAQALEVPVASLLSDDASE